MVAAGKPVRSAGEAQAGRSGRGKPRRPLRYLKLQTPPINGTATGCGTSPTSEWEAREIGTCTENRPELRRHRAARRPLADLPYRRAPRNTGVLASAVAEGDVVARLWIVRR